MTRPSRHAPPRGDETEKGHYLDEPPPMLASIVAPAGIDLIHFGLVFVLSTMVGLIATPVGITMFIHPGTR